MLTVQLYTEDDNGQKEVFCSFDLTDAMVVALEEKAELLNLSAEAYLYRLLLLACRDA